MGWMARHQFHIPKFIFLRGGGGGTIASKCVNREVWYVGTVYNSECYAVLLMKVRRRQRVGRMVEGGG